jgi:uncharacterized integral membrane protein
MAFLGFVLAAAAVALAVGVALDNSGEATLSIFGQTAPGMGSQWQVFFAGAVVAVAFVVGLVLTFMGLGRMMRARREMRYLREEHEESLTTLEMEKQQLQRELARVKREAAPRTPRPTGPSPGGRSQVIEVSSFFDRTE